MCFTTRGRSPVKSLLCLGVRPARNSTIVTFSGLVIRPPTSPPLVRSQVLFTWVSASNEVLPLKIVGLEIRVRFGPPGTQIGRNTTLPHLILEVEDNDDDDDDDD